MATATAMPRPMPRATVGGKTVWIGRVVSAIPVFMLVLSGVLKLAGGEQMLKDWAAFGYPVSALAPIGAVELVCAAVYLFPRTAVLGAVLITGYLGGAVATHVRVQQPV